VVYYLIEKQRWKIITLSRDIPYNLHPIKDVIRWCRSKKGRLWNNQNDKDLLLTCVSSNLFSSSTIRVNISKDFKEKSGQLQIWTKNSSSRAITQPKVIRPERNSNLNCNSSRYSHIPNNLIFGMRLYLDELQFKFEFGSGRMTFG
jgi:hypothetical protein